MKETVFESFTTLCSVIPRSTEFWSAIFGAVVGGLIAYIIQVKALREGRRLRDEDHQRVRHALGTALLFKMIRIHSNLCNIHRHIEESFEGAEQRELEVEEPWQFVQPLANFPDPVHFSPEEMGMLLALKNDEVFNLVLSMDVIHNSLVDAVKVLSTERRALTERLTPGEVDGTVVRGVFDEDQELALRPRMIEVNSLIKKIRANAKDDTEKAENALVRLHKVLRDKLGFINKLEFKVQAKDMATPENS